MMMSSADLVLVCVINLLGRSASQLPPIRIVQMPPPGASKHVQGYVNRVDGSIHLVASTAAFREAEAAQSRGPGRCPARPALAMIASVVAHEEWHLKHGPDESQAYEAQLGTLRRLGLGSSQEARNVYRAMIVVRARTLRRIGDSTLSATAAPD
jgi:hypothetical protein